MAEEKTVKIETPTLPTIYRHVHTLSLGPPVPGRISPSPKYSEDWPDSIRNSRRE